MRSVTPSGVVSVAPERHSTGAVPVVDRVTITLNGEERELSPSAVNVVAEPSGPVVAVASRTTPVRNGSGMNVRTAPSSGAPPRWATT